MPRYLYRRAQVKGLLGGSRAWTMVWVVLFGTKVIRRVLRDKPEIVYSEPLVEGETLVISANDRQPRVFQV